MKVDGVIKKLAGTIRELLAKGLVWIIWQHNPNVAY